MEKTGEGCGGQQPCSVGGNNHALAQKIAREHPGMQPSSNAYYSIIMVTSPCVE